MVTRAITGKTARCIKNKLIDACDASGLVSLPYALQTILMNDFIRSVQQSDKEDWVPGLGGPVFGAQRQPQAASLAACASRLAI